MVSTKKAWKVIVVLMISFVLCGCEKAAKTEVEKDEIKELLCAVKSYECDTQITFYTDNQKNELRMKQVCDPEGNYVLTVESPEHLKGYTTIFDKKGVKEYNPITKKTIPLKISAAKNQVLFGTFVHNYLESKDCSAYIEKKYGVLTTVIETSIPGQYKYLVRQKVWFDEKKRAPLKMQIYDQEGNVTIEVKFQNFNYNTEMKWDL